MDWVEFTTENATGKRRNRSTMLKFEQRDQAGIHKITPLVISEFSGVGPAYPFFSASIFTAATRHVYVPSNAVKFRIWLEAYAGAGTGYVQGELGPGQLGHLVLSDALPITTAVPYGFFEMIFQNVRSLRAQDVDLNFRVSNNNGSLATNVRIDRVQGARFTWD